LTMTRLGPVLALLVISAPAFGAERGYSVTDFDRIDVSGPYVVIVEAGKSPSARATGSNDAIDRLAIETRGRTLRIRPSANSWGGWPGAQIAAPTIRITVPAVREAYLNGSGSITINQLKAQTARIGLSGSGQMSIGKVDTDKLFAQLRGSGTLSLGGKAALVQLNADGSGAINASQLEADVLELKSNSAGLTQARARQTAKIVATSAGDVRVDGDAACTVTSIGSGQVFCGANRR
jgi:Putative auto-transporter adhesin, head GIN domain